MSNVDQRGRLDADVFTYRVNKEGSVFIAWRGRQVRIVKGDKARKLLAQLENADHKAEQLALAKITGNFKHGNER